MKEKGGFRKLPAWLFWSLASIVLWGTWGLVSKVASAGMDAYANQLLYTVGLVLSNPTNTAVLGTHTHIQTADNRVLKGGTAFITDVGMCGPRDSVIGVKTELVLERFLTQMPVRFEVADGNVWLEGVVIELGNDGNALRIEPFEEPA